MTRALPFTKDSIKRRINAVREAGLFVIGIRTDGTLIVGDKPVDVTSLVPPDAQPSPPRKFGEKLGGQGEAGRP
jgi:hypothetical protein